MADFKSPEQILEVISCEASKQSCRSLAKGTGVYEGAIRHMMGPKQTFPRLDTFLKLVDHLEIPAEIFLKPS